MFECVFVYVYMRERKTHREKRMCVFVCERERKKESKKEREGANDPYLHPKGPDLL